MNSKFSKRWVAYFDILGFKELVNKASFYANPNIVMKIFERAFQETSKELKPLETVGDKISQLYFSDTFVFYTEDDSGGSYKWIQSVAKNFIRGCLDGNPFIPLRGAITCGELHVEKDRNIFFGKAFIEAHEIAEVQDWIGLVLTKTAEERISQYDPCIHPARHHFLMSDIPVRLKPSGKISTLKYFAYSFHAEKLDQTTRIRTLEREMKQLDENIKRKYRNTIHHIKSIATSSV